MIVQVTNQRKQRERTFFLVSGGPKIKERNSDKIRNYVRKREYAEEKERNIKRERKRWRATANVFEREKESVCKKKEKKMERRCKQKEFSY